MCEFYLIKQLSYIFYFIVSLKIMTKKEAIVFECLIFIQLENCKLYLIERMFFIVFKTFIVLLHCLQAHAHA